MEKENAGGIAQISPARSVEEAARFARQEVAIQAEKPAVSRHAGTDVPAAPSE